MSRGFVSGACATIVPNALAGDSMCVVRVEYGHYVCDDLRMTEGELTAIEIKKNFLQAVRQATLAAESTCMKRKRE